MNLAPIRCSIDDHSLNFIGSPLLPPLLLLSIIKYHIHIPRHNPSYSTVFNNLDSF